jgi:AraC family transcriptional regulator
MFHAAWAHWQWVECDASKTKSMADRRSEAEVERSLARAFGDNRGPQPTTKILRTPNLLVSEIRSDHEDTVVRGAIPQDDAYVLTLHLRNRPAGGISAEGRWNKPENFAAGNAGIVDLRMKLMSEYAGPLHCMSFYLKREVLNREADEAEAPRIVDLRHRAGQGFSDPIVRHLLMSLRPALAVAPNEVNPLYADHVSRAIVAHMATTYGGLRVRPSMARGGLTPAQERRAKDLMDARLDGSLTLADLAGACRLSLRHFARAFRQSTGQPPHRWLVARRLDKAQALLETSNRSLNEIAALCGFASQSHFTRVFTGSMGLSPGAWRRIRQD